jgi:hypothetical protein
MNTKLQNVQFRKHPWGLRRSPVIWLSLVLAAFVLSCFPERLAEYLSSQELPSSSKSSGRKCKGCAALKNTSESVSVEASASAPIVQIPFAGFSPVEVSVPEPLQRTAAKEEPPPVTAPKESDESPSALAELPGPDRLFRLESEMALRERLRQEAGPNAPLRLEFPLEPPVRSTTPPPSRDQAHVMLVEPGYVAYRPLLFQDVYTERYGWEIGGALQPALSTAKFYVDFFGLPYSLTKAILCPIDTGAGRCLPGDPVPYRLEIPRVLPEKHQGCCCPGTGHMFLH